MCMYHLAHLLLLAEGCNLSIAVKDNPQVIAINHAPSVITLIYTKFSSPISMNMRGQLPT